MLEFIAEWGGMLTGLAGAALVALNNPVLSKYGFIAFLISNALWIAFGLLIGAWGLIFMQLGFTATSLIGIYRWFLVPPKSEHAGVAAHDGVA